MDNEILMLIQGIIGLIILIVFFVMAANIAKIKRHIINPTGEDIGKDIKLLLFKGKKAEALDRYYDLAFIFVNQDDFHQDNARKLEQISIKIKDLGGHIPKEITDFIAKYK